MSSSANTNGNDVPGLEYTARKTGDVVADDVMAEIVRRLRFAQAPNGDSALVGFGGDGARISDNSGNQITDPGDGLFIALGAGLGVSPGNGLGLNASNQIEFTRRVFIQVDTIAADGNKIFTLPEQMDGYSVSVAPVMGDPTAAARWWVVNKTSTAVTVGFAGFAANTKVETTCTELP